MRVWMRIWDKSGRSEAAAENNYQWMTNLREQLWWSGPTSESEKYEQCPPITRQPTSMPTTATGRESLRSLRSAPLSQHRTFIRISIPATASPITRTVRSPMQRVVQHEPAGCSSYLAVVAGYYRQPSERWTIDYGPVIIMIFRPLALSIASSLAAIMAAARLCMNGNLNSRKLPAPLQERFERKS